MAGLIIFKIFYFSDYLTDVYGNLAMVNYPYNTSFLANLPAYPVRVFCSYLEKPMNDSQLIDVCIFLSFYFV